MLPGQYQGVTGNYMSFATQTSSPHFRIRADEFEACTGARITFSEANNVFVDPIEDLGTRSKEGLGIADAYFMSYSHFPEASALGLAETLNDRIRNSEAQLQWQDVLPQVQIMGQYRKDGQNNLDFLMFDGDFFVPIVRLDLLERHNMPLPNTWEEVINLARFFHGRDLNDDGVPDYGLCHFPRADAGFWDWWWPELLYSTWATYSQTHGPKEGFFFNDETFQPNLDDPGFRKAAEVWKDLWNYGGEGCITNNMATGRCAIGFSPPGCWKGIFLNGISRKAANGTVLWRPTMANGQYAEPYRLPPFGTTEVVNEQGQLAPCTARLCPKGEPINPRGHVQPDRTSMLPESPLKGQLINRAPFFWSGGLGTLIRKSARPAVKDMLWDFFVYLNSPATSTYDVSAYASWVDSWRYSQLTEAGDNFVVQSTWSRDAYQEHRSVMLSSLGVSSNGALNLRIPGIKDYTSTVLAACMEEYISGNITLDRLVSKVSQGWQDTTDGLGLIYQLQTYRAALGQEPLSEPRLCQLHREAMDAINPVTCRQYDPTDTIIVTVLIAVGSALLGIVVLIFCGWVVRTARHKRRLVAEQKKRMTDTVRESLAAVGVLKYPMVLINAAQYLALGAMRASEACRDGPENLVYLDTCEDVDHFLETYCIIFLSHQWLSWHGPDPRGVQYECSCNAIKKLIKDKGWDASKCFVWCDYISIPQRCSAIQTLAIVSLPVYSSKVSAFIVIAPSAEHENTAVPCSVKSYRTRAWCRAEMLSHALCKGIANMYLANETGLIPFTRDSTIVTDSMRVFEGEMTCCRMKHTGMEVCDRQKLVVPFLGLYSYVVHSLAWQADKMDEDTKGFFESIIQQKERNFPSTFDFVTEAGVEKRPLFSGLLDLMEQEVKAAGQENFENFRRNSSMVMCNPSQSHSVAVRLSSMNQTDSMPVDSHFSAVSLLTGHANSAKAQAQSSSNEDQVRELSSVPEHEGPGDQVVVDMDQEAVRAQVKSGKGYKIVGRTSL